MMAGLAAWADNAGSWLPPAARGDTQFDWIELTSGEWLKGEFRYMYDESVEFDSDNLGLLSIDWSDIKQVYFAQPMSVRLDNRTERRGDMRVGDGQLYFTPKDEPAGDMPETAPQTEVVSITPRAKSEWDRWELKANIAADYQSGNTDETSYTASASTVRRTISTRFKLSYLGNYTLTDQVETTNNHRVNSSFDYFFDDRLFVRPFDGEYYHDPISNIEMQVTVGGGLGYKVIDTSSVDWEVQGGPAYQYIEYVTVQAGQGIAEHSPAFNFTSDLDYDITDDLEFNLNYQAILTKESSGLLTQNLVAKLSYELNSIFDVFTMLQFTRVEKPQARSDGTIPKKDDAILSLGLGVDI